MCGNAGQINTEYLGVIAPERLQVVLGYKNVVPHEIFPQPGAIYILIKSYLCKRPPTSTILLARTNTSLSQQSSAGP